MHELSLRVYYEDTDLAGIVYYANYLKFIERGRSELIREIGVDQELLKREQDTVFAVRRVTADYLTPARFDDVLTVRTEVTGSSGARLHLRQDVMRKSTLCFSAEVTLVCLTQAGKATRLPADIRQRLEGKLAK